MKRYLKMFLLTFLILFCILLILGIYPFGDKTLIVTDLRDQYLVFINYLKSILLNSGNIFYTFSGSMGESFLPLASYYLISIFNIFTLPFKGDLMPLILTFIILIKISLSSVTMLYYIDKKYGHKDINYLFALSYGLMSYNVAFYFHIMWLDAIILLPLVTLGIEDIFEKRKIKLYLISLSLTILSNYYIGVIVCIFSVIYFIYYYSINYDKKYNLKIVIKKYIIGSLLSGMICMVVLLPTLFSLGNSKAIIGTENEVIARSFNSVEILSKTLTMSFDMSNDSNTIWHGGPNIFVGSLVVLLIISYFGNKKIDKKKKLVNAILLIILFLICRIHFLDLIFHGFSEPNCFDFRQAFIISFFLILIGYEGFKNLKKFSKKEYLIVGIFIFHLIIYFFNLSYFRGIKGLYLVMSFIIFLLLIYSISKKNYYILYAVVIIDLGINSVNIISTITNYEKKASDIFSFQEYYENNDKVIAKIKENDNTFYRLEKEYHHTNNINDSMMFNYYGISHFDSTSNANTEKLLENIGFRRVVSRVFYDQGSTRAVDMLLGIKYVLSYDNHFDYVKEFDMNGINVLKNNYYLAPVILYNNKQDINYTENVFDNLNSLFNSLININNLYQKVDYKINYYNIRKDNDTYYKVGEDAYIEYTFTKDSINNYYLYFLDNLVRDDYQTADIYINNEIITKYFDKYNYGMIDLSNLDNNVVIRIVLNQDSITFKDGLIYLEDSIKLNEIYNLLKNNSLVKLNKSLNIEIDNYDNEYALLSIPYEDGWNILVDNSKVDYFNHGGFVSIKIPIGSHNISLSFIPKGIRIGIIISVISIIVSGFIIYKEGHEKN